MTGPSAIGSLYGKPISIMLAPFLASVLASSLVLSMSGSPAAMKGINAFFVPGFQALKSSIYCIHLFGS